MAKTSKKTSKKTAKPAKAKKGKTRAGKLAKAKKPAKKKPVKTVKGTSMPMPAPTSASTGAVVSGTDPCVCGGAPEDHGRNPEYPGSTACTHCTECVAYEADPDAIADEASA